MIHVTLEPDELLIGKVVGNLRSLLARSHGVVDKKMGSQDGAEADYIGFVAEYATAKFLNVSPDLGLTPRSGSNDGVTPKGHRYDVKSTKHKTGKLICTLKDNPDVDIYILAIVDLPVVSLIGWATKEFLRQECHLIDLGYGQGYGVTQDKLNQFNRDRTPPR